MREYSIPTEITISQTLPITAPSVEEARNKALFTIWEGFEKKGIPAIIHILDRNGKIILKGETQK